MTATSRPWLVDFLGHELSLFASDSIEHRLTATLNGLKMALRAMSGMRDWHTRSAAGQTTSLLRDKTTLTDWL